MIVAAKTLALTAYDIFKNPAIIEEATKELAKKRGDNFKYEALLGDRKPPLDYRKYTGLDKIKGLASMPALFCRYTPRRVHFHYSPVTLPA
jgi:hypothetical protein